nr:carboxypeptidase A1 isoform X3 [Nothobranchius furzeri]XP_054588721.1 carboxypeptidase A1 isoform X3 [Nothobranchius furzeri]
MNQITPTFKRLVEQSRATLRVMMRGFFSFAALVMVALGKEVFNGHQVLRIVAKDGAQLSLIKHLEDRTDFELDFWRRATYVSSPVDVRVPSHSLHFVKSYLEKLDIHYSIMIEDLQVLLNKEQEEIHSAARAAQLKDTDSFDYSNYHTLTEIYTFQDMLVAENPNLVSKIVIGQSSEGRPLNVLKFSTGGTNRPAVWIDTGIHSREWVTQASGIWFAKKIVKDYRRDPTVTAVLNNMDIFLEIVVNPDGYHYTHTNDRMWRKNRKLLSNSRCVGIDLNRNWDAGFGGEQLFYWCYRGTDKTIKTTVVCGAEEANTIFSDFHASPREAISARFYWPGMSVDINNWVSQCALCQASAATIKKPAAYIPIKFEAPKRILTDQGKELVNSLNKRVCGLLKIKRSLCSPPLPTNKWAGGENEWHHPESPVQSCWQPSRNVG